MTTHVAPPFQIPQTLLDELTKLGPLLDAATQAHALGVEVFTNNIFQKPLDTDFKVVRTYSSPRDLRPSSPRPTFAAPAAAVTLYPFALRSSKTTSIFNTLPKPR